VIPLASRTGGFPGSPAPSTPCRITLAGFGTVGRSVVRLLQQSPGDAELVSVLTRRAADRRADWAGDEVRWTESIDEALDAGTDVFVELIGGLDPAERWIRTALERGISVVTANKQVIAQHGPELLALAASRGCQLRFEGSVAGGVPVIRAIESGLASDAIGQVAGILNGTCNYILTRIEREGADFDAALREAQALGFAEANPSQDIDGLDARAKLAILAMVALRLQVPAEQIAAESIAAVTPLDFKYAHLLHCTIRQVAWMSREARRPVVSGGVGPALVPLTSPLARGNGSENLVTVKGQFGGETSFGGRGAGGDPTAVAVVSDILAIARGARPPGGWRAVPADEVSTDYAAPHYVRFTVADRPGIIAALASVFAAHDINIDAILQEPGFPASARPFVVSLDAAPARAVAAALDAIRSLDFHVVPPLAMPVLRGGAPEVTMEASGMERPAFGRAVERASRGAGGPDDQS
jgi:homoserine dehydrogenase